MANPNTIEIKITADNKNALTAFQQIVEAARSASGQTNTAGAQAGQGFTNMASGVAAESSQISNAMNTISTTLTAIAARFGVAAEAGTNFKNSGNGMGNSFQQETNKINNSLNNTIGKINQLRSDISGTASEVLGLNIGNPFLSASKGGEGFLGTLSKIGMSVYGVVETFRLIKEAGEKVFSPGLKFDQQMETYRMGVGAVLSSLMTVHGEELKITDAMKIADGEISDINKKATTIGLKPDELMTAFQAILGPALQAKMTLQDIVDLATTGTKAVKGVLGPQGNDLQVAQELRAMVTGNIDQNASVSRMLGITSTAVQSATQQGNLGEYLKEQLSGFKGLADIWPDSMTGTLESFEAKYQQSSGKAFEGLFESLKKKVQEFGDEIFKVNDETKEVNFNPEILLTLKTMVDYTILLIDKFSSAGRAVSTYMHGPLNEAVYLLKLVIEHANGVLAAIIAWNAIQKAISLYQRMETAIMACQAAMRYYRIEMVMAMGGTISQALTAANAVTKIEAAANLAKIAIRGLASATLWGAIAMAAGWVAENIINNFNKVDKWKQDHEQAQKTNKGSDGSISWLLFSEESGGDYAAYNGGKSHTTNDPGGLSYGAYQFATKMNTPQNFLEWLGQADPEIRDSLIYSTTYTPDGPIDMTSWPGEAQFIENWRATLDKYGTRFADLQDTYARQKYYDNTNEALTQDFGFDANSRSNAVQGAIFSTAIQHGSGRGGGAYQIMEQAAQDAGVPNISYLNDEDFLNYLYQARSESTSDPNLKARYARELQAALNGYQQNNIPKKGPISQNDLQLKKQQEAVAEVQKAQTAKLIQEYQNVTNEQLADLQQQESQLKQRHDKTNAGTASDEEKISEEDYNSQIKDITNRSTAAQIGLLNQRITAKQQEKANSNLLPADRIKIDSDIESFQSQIKVKTTELQTSLGEIDAAQQQAIQAIKDAATQVAIQNLKNQGKLKEAKALELELNNRANLAKFQANGFTDAYNKLKQNMDIEQNGAAIEETLQGIDQINKDLAVSENDYLLQIKTGLAGVNTTFKDQYKKFNDAIYSKLLDLKTEYDNAQTDEQRQKIKDKYQSLSDSVFKLVDDRISAVNSWAQDRSNLVNAEPGWTSGMKQERQEENDRVKAKDTANAYGDIASKLEIKGSAASNLAKLQGINPDLWAIQLRNLEAYYNKLATLPDLLTRVEYAGRQGLENGLNNFFESGYQKCHKLIDAVEDLAISILTEMNKVFSQQLTRNIMNSLYGASTDNSMYTFSLPPMTYRKFGGLISTFATGGDMGSGIVKGPGTSISDSILAWSSKFKKFIGISDGEYVVKGAAVKKYGTDFMDRLNNGLIPSGFGEIKAKYATGGALSGKTIAGPQEIAATLSPGDTNVSLRNINIFDPEDIGKYNHSRSGTKSMLNWIGKNKGTVKTILDG